jgi:hypothetical protein
MTKLLILVVIASPRFVNPVLDPIKSVFTVRELINPVFALILEVANVLVKNPRERVVEKDERAAPTKVVDAYPAVPRP